MRRFVSALVGLSLLGGQSAVAARPCASMADQTVFEVQALRTELVVLATGCHDDSDYNAFINKYKADLQANEHSVDAYFQRRYGRAGQTEHDRFVTELANAMSRQGSDLGGDFCPRNSLIFKEVLSLDAPSELMDYAAGKNLVPTSVDVCGAPPAPVVVRRVEAKAKVGKK